MVRAGTGGRAFPRLTGLIVRPERSADLDGIRHVNLEAFEGQTEATLVDDLRAGGHLHSSLVAEHESAVVGHCALSHGSVGDQPVLVLAPVAVLPGLQGLGIGGTLIRRILTSAGDRPVTVLGEPAYYGRFGFRNAEEFGVENPFPVEPGALQLIGAGDLRPGTLEYAAPFLAE